MIARSIHKPPPARRDAPPPPERVCSVPGCAVEIRRQHLMCLAQWREVPGRLQEEVTESLDAWLGGLAPVRPYLAARASAIVHVGKLHSLDVSKAQADAARWEGASK